MDDIAKPALRQRIARGMRYAWASPATLVGLMFGALLCATGSTARRVEGIVEIGGGRIGRLVERMPPSMRFEAVTLGHVVIGVDHEALALCRAHEHVHVRQYELYGILFFPLYLISSAVAWAAGGDPYRHNHFEQQAFVRSARTRDPAP